MEICRLRLHFDKKEEEFFAVVFSRADLDSESFQVHEAELNEFEKLCQKEAMKIRIKGETLWFELRSFTARLKLFTRSALYVGYHVLKTGNKLVWTYATFKSDALLSGKTSPDKLEIWPDCGFDVLERVHPEYRGLRLSQLFVLKRCWLENRVWALVYVEKNNFKQVKRIALGNGTKIGTFPHGEHTMILMKKSDDSCTDLNFCRISNSDIVYYLQMYYGNSQYATNFENFMIELEIGGKFLGGHILTENGFKIVTVSLLADWITIHHNKGTIGSAPAFVSGICFFKENIPEYDPKKIPKDLVIKYMRILQNQLNIEYALLDLDQSLEPLISHLSTLKETIGTSKEQYVLLTYPELKHLKIPTIQMEWNCRFLDPRFLSSLLFFDENVKYAKL